jgi:hypothetical protein
LNRSAGGRRNLCIRPQKLAFTHTRLSLAGESG